MPTDGKLCTGLLEGGEGSWLVDRALRRVLRYAEFLNGESGK
jgi:hypothetical protein